MMIRNTKANEHDVIVIGAGLGGLASACTLAARGYRVRLFDKNAWLGGKAAELKEQGFRFDMGPTIVTMPKVLRRIFDEAGESLDEHLEMVRLDPQWRCFFDDGTTMDLREQVDDMKQEFSRFAQRLPDGNTAAPFNADRIARDYEQFIHYTRRLHDISEKFFFWKSIGGMGDLLKISQAIMPRTLRDLASMRMGRSVASTIRSYVPDARVAQMLDHFTQYVGSSPYGSPAILCGIASMQVNEGVWYPIGGTRAIPVALTKLAERLGVQITTDLAVERILVEDDHVRGVQLTDQSTVMADAVVSNMDSVRTYRELIGGSYAQRFDKRRNYEPACSGVELYLGLNKAYDHLAHHDFVFSRDPHEEFDCIYHKGEPAPDPTCYLASTSRTEPATAPPGGDALYVLVHTPYLRPHHDWSKMLPEYRKVILDKLRRTAGMEDIEQRIIFERALTPQDIHERYNVLNGAIYGLASHGKFLGAFKPGNRSSDIRGLYLAGGAAHPGPGMPMVLMSGWIAADTLDQDAVVEPGSTSAEARHAAQPAGDL